MCRHGFYQVCPPLEHDSLYAPSVHIGEFQEEWKSGDSPVEDQNTLSKRTDFLYAQLAEASSPSRSSLNPLLPTLFLGTFTATSNSSTVLPYRHEPS